MPMEYEGQICRPPMERSSYMLPVAVGCAYNRCTFCTLFKHLTYRQLPMEDIRGEILRVKELGGDPKAVFLGDGNAFGMGTQRLLEILTMIREAFPSCRQVNMDATVTDISRKTDQELEQLYAAGVRSLYLGIESGLDDVLTFMKKDHTIEQAREQIRRLKSAGMIYNAHMMTGIAGHGRGLENAQATARFFNETKPKRIINFSVFQHKKAPLYQDILAGRYIPATEQENLREERKLLELLDVEGLEYDGFHDCVLVRLRGTLPHDREKLLRKVDDAIAVWEQKEPLVAYF